MNSSLYIGATGMKGLSEGMNVITNNLANISTIGFKSQGILFSDILYQTQSNNGEWWNNQDGSCVAVGQVGMGLQVEAVRTSFNQGEIQTTNNITDLSLNGKGFFQVTDGVNTYYTRAGDFNTDNEGVIRNPAGYALNGYSINADGTRGELTQIQIDKYGTIPAKATSSVNLSLNVYSDEDLTTSEENPFFSLLEQYSAQGGLAYGDYSSSQQFTVYDDDGNAQTLTAYFDNVATDNPNNKYSEFIIVNPDAQPAYDADGNLIEGQEANGVLMSGVLSFDSQGNLVNISAFTSSKEGSADLTDWTAADMENGNPTLNLNGQTISINFGMSSQGGWENTPANAAAVGTDAANLPNLGTDVTLAQYPTTFYNTTAMTNSYNQDGYAEGVLSNYTISSDGIITGTYSNGQTMDMCDLIDPPFNGKNGQQR